MPPLRKERAKMGHPASHPLPSRARGEITMEGAPPRLTPHKRGCAAHRDYFVPSRFLNTATSALMPVFRAGSTSGAKNGEWFDGRALLASFCGSAPPRLK